MSNKHICLSYSVFICKVPSASVEFLPHAHLYDRLKLQHCLLSSFKGYNQQWSFDLKWAENSDQKSNVTFSLLMESWAKVSDAESWEILFSISPASFAVTVTTDSRLQYAQNFCGEYVYCHSSLWFMEIP